MSSRPRDFAMRPAVGHNGGHRINIAIHLGSLRTSSQAALGEQPSEQPSQPQPQVERQAEAQQQQAGHQQTNNHIELGPPASNQWALGEAATQTGLEMRQRLDQASSQLGHSLRHLYVSASSVAQEMPPAYHNIPGIVPYYQGRQSGPPPSYDEVVNPHAGPPTYQSLFGQMRQARKRSRGLLDLTRRLTFILLSTIGCTVLLAFMILIPFTMIIVGAIYIDDCRIEHLPAYLLLGGLIWASKNVFHCYRQCCSAARLARPLSRPTSELELPVGEQPAGGHHLNSLEATGSSLGAGSGGQSHTARLQADLEGGQPGGGTQMQESSSLATKSFYCELVLNFSLLGWFIAGCVIVIRNSQPDFHNPLSSKYCNKTVYMYTFWIIAIAMLLFCLLVGCFCCLLVSSAMAGRHGQGNQTPSSSSSSSSSAGSDLTSSGTRTGRTTSAEPASSLAA